MSTNAMPTEAAFQPGGTLTQGDVVRFGYFHIARRLGLILALFAVATLLSLTLTLISDESEATASASWVYALVLLFLLFLTVFIYLNARKMYRKLRQFREPMRYEFGETRIGLEGASFKSEIRWDLLVYGIYETRTMFLIYHTSRGAWILPKRFFAGGEQEIERWRVFVMDHLAQPKLFHACGMLGRWF